MNFVESVVRWLSQRPMRPHDNQRYFWKLNTNILVVQYISNHTKSDNRFTLNNKYFINLL